MQQSVGTIDKSVELANVWLGEISDELNHINKEDAWACLNAVLRTVRDRVPVDEAAHFAAQLPMVIRGSFYEGWNPSQAPHKWRHRDEYLSAVRDRLPGRENVDIEETVRAVLKVVGHHMTHEELEKLKSIHPQEVRDLWPV